MQLLIPTTTLPPRLALVLVFALLSYCASAAPHPHTKRCNDPVPSNNAPCFKAEDCCAFSYCQAEDQGDGTAIGMCSPAFSEVPYLKIVTPAEFVQPFSDPNAPVCTFWSIVFHKHGC
ncbi:hypothetical protein FIBSPDRAFT_871036 [Athelia psychrophila]|uniref:Uncharacterized protein n=1 Tax=Athelia psychrophila TaxID=1759441 RepID=A0A166AMW0_9AGAM|nr:hypothetical protein FIBSPDRAFT_879254 [Fibularhizoctonia sp. CBS 109695]KZP11776.1 hypothetical protein FIBSPDRAFT_871036 [Fibularhizoctonia sp. CBS 109695]